MVLWMLKLRDKRLPLGSILVKLQPAHTDITFLPLKPASYTYLSQANFSNLTL